MALYELEQVNALVTEGYEINKAIDFESNILGDMNARSIKLRELLLLFQDAASWLVKLHRIFLQA